MIQGVEWVNQLDEGSLSFEAPAAATGLTVDDFKVAKRKSDHIACEIEREGESMELRLGEFSAFRRGSKALTVA